MMLGQEFALSAAGRLREAQELAEACLDAAQLSGNAQYLACALFEQCWVATRAGDVAKALGSGEEALELARTLEERILQASAAWALAGALLETGQAQRCRDLLLAALGGPELGLVPANSRCPAYEMLTRAELALGRPDAAAEWAQAAEGLAERLALPVATGAALRARAEVLLVSDEAEDAAGMALDGSELERGAGAPVEAARSLIVAGRALVEAGQRARGLRKLERAEEELAACGAEGYRRQAIRELRRLGRRVTHRPAARNIGSLTPREQEIAQLVTDGRTNREIAGSLHLSVKTVDRHLSNILTKLDVPSRVAVAALVARDGTGLAS
jgi:DNA-binding CsgD family transcriptional regulator